MPYPYHRRLFGLLLGALTGLVFLLVSQYINHLILPGITFYQPPFGAGGNTLMGLLTGALLGLVTSWPSDGTRGVLAGSLVSALVVAASVFLPGINEAGVLLPRMVGVTLIFLPTMALLAVGLFAFRWLVDREEAAYRESLHWKPPAPLPRILLPLLLVAAAGLLGLTSMYNDLARTVTPRMQALIESARSAATPEQLPEPLRGRDVHSIYENAGQPFTLQWDRDESNRFAIGRPNTSPYDQSTVIARFANGYLLACMYPHPEMEPRCKDFPPETSP